MSKLNDADLVANEIMQVFIRFASGSSQEINKVFDWKPLVDEFTLLNGQMQTLYRQFYYDNGKAILRAFRYVYFNESFQSYRYANVREPQKDSYNFEAPRFNKDATQIV